MRQLPFIFFLTLFSCGGAKEIDEVMDTQPDGAWDAAETSEIADAGETGGKCFANLDTEKEFSLADLETPVKVIRDKWGIPHIYASNLKDLFYAEGFVVASDRLIQMHAMRLISSGRFAATPVGDASDLSADVYMRVLNLRGVAEKMWENIEKNEPLLKDILESYAKGVNAYLEAIKSGKVIPPLEYGSLGEFSPWTPVDSLVIGRLQSWDLSFDGLTDEITLMKRLEALSEEFGNSALKGIVQDVLHFAPASDTTVLPLETGERSGSLAPPPNLPNEDYFKRFPSGYFARMEKILKPVKEKIRGTSGTPRGSNNWVVSGSLTESGSPMLANDTHLSLRNPPVFYQIHLNTKDSGGDIDLAGVCFPGIPGIILGHNGYFAWGGTVYYADVTDVYIETIKEGDPPAVLFNNNQVEIVIRKEEFRYNKPAGGCDSYLNDFIKGLKYDLKEEGGKCVLVVDVEVVPHHGPIIPASKVDSGTGTITALSWRWTGFEPSNDLKAVAGLMFGKNYKDFFAALKNFGVGAQNWVYAGTDGHIAYTTYCRLPERGHLKEGPVLYPPYLPMPGDGCCEWTGDLALEKFPQALDPKEGFLVTANNDANGVTLDNNPVNDGDYYGFMWDIGYRGERATKLLKEKISKGKLSFAELQEIQADHWSPLGEKLAFQIILSVDEAVNAKNGDPAADPSLAQFVDQKLLEARDRIAGWSFKAANGALPESSQAEKDDAIAASIFNVWLIYVSQAIFDNKGLADMEDQFKGRILARLFASPDLMATYDAQFGDSLLWDDPTTESVVETRDLVVVSSLASALKFLANPEKVGPSQSGGFGTGDMSKWLWGKLHTVTLKHPLGDEANIPPKSKYPDGFPRHGDNFNLDASNAGLGDFDFTFSSGATIRAVYEANNDYFEMENVIPGGQSGSLFTPHYSDQMELWVANKTLPVHFSKEKLEGDAESCVVLKPL